MKDLDWLMFDINNLMFRILGVEGTRSQVKNEKNLELREQLILGLWRHSFLNSIISNITKMKPKKGIVFAYDVGSSWRKQIYPDYKGTREKTAKSLCIDKKKFFQMTSDFIAELRVAFGGCIHLYQDGIEADDIIATFVKKHNRDRICLVSTDKDFYQLHKYPNYSQSIFKGDIAVCPNPTEYLFEKICMGDTSDNIPKIKYGMGEVKFKEWNESGTLKLLIETDRLVGENFKMNQSLIDFEFIRDDITEQCTKIIEDGFSVKTKHNEYALYTMVTKYKLHSIERYSMGTINTFFKNFGKEFQNDNVDMFVD